MVRIKHRYLVGQILYPDCNPHEDLYMLALHAPTPDALTIPVILRLIRDAVAQLFGDICGAGLAGSGLLIKYWSAATSTFVLRCRRESARWVRAALVFIRTLPLATAKRECVVQVVHVSGTISKCQAVLVQRARQLLGRVRGVEEVQSCGGIFEDYGRGVDEDDEGRVLIMGKGKDEVGPASTTQEDLGVAVAGLDEDSSENEDMQDE